MARGEDTEEAEGEEKSERVKKGVNERCEFFLFQKMGREIEVSLNEKEFLLGALKLNTRIDGRAPFDLRPFSVSIDKDLGRYGQAEVLLGKTR